MPQHMAIAGLEKERCLGIEGSRILVPAIDIPLRPRSRSATHIEIMGGLERHRKTNWCEEVSAIKRGAGRFLNATITGVRGAERVVAKV